MNTLSTFQKENLVKLVLVWPALGEEEKTIDSAGVFDTI